MKTILSFLMITMGFLSCGQDSVENAPKSTRACKIAATQTCNEIFTNVVQRRACVQWGVGFENCGISFQVEVKGSQTPGLLAACQTGLIALDRCKRQQ